MVYIVGEKDKKPKKKRQKMYTCGNCGHSEPVTEELKNLSFESYGNKTSKVTCPNCGAYTIQRYWDKFKHGQFLMVKPHLRRG